jgi:hypothetical protein
MFVRAGDDVLCVRPVHFNRRNLIQEQMDSSHETVTTILTSTFHEVIIDKQRHTNSSNKND